MEYFFKLSEKKRHISGFDYCVGVSKSVNYNECTLLSCSISCSKYYIPDYVYTVRHCPSSSFLYHDPPAPTTPDFG